MPDVIYTLADLRSEVELILYAAQEPFSDNSGPSYRDVCSSLRAIKISAALVLENLTDLAEPLPAAAQTYLGYDPAMSMTDSEAIAAGLTPPEGR